MSGEQTACAGRCGTCKHWTRYADDSDVSCHGKHAGYCISNKFVYSDQATETPHDGLLYWDGESYCAEFNTGENFGCVHWAAE